MGYRVSKKLSDWQIYKRLLKYVHQYWYIFLIAAIASALYSAVDAGMMRLLQPLIDDGFVNQDPQVIKMIPIVLPLIFLVRGLFNFASNYSLGWLSRRIVVSVRQEMFAHYLKLPARFYDMNSAGALLSKLTFNVEQIAKACTDAILDSVRNAFLAIFLLAVMVSISFRLTAWFFMAAPLIYGLFVVASYRFRKFSHQIQKSMGHVTHITEENLTGYREVRIFGGQERERELFNQATENNRKLEMRLEITQAVSVPLIQFIGGCGLALTLYMATQKSGLISLTAGQFTAFASSMLGLLKPIKELTSVSSKIQRGIAGAQSIFEVLDLPVEKDKGTIAVSRVKGNIVMHDLSFRYDITQPYVLRNIDCDIKAGEVIALVGHSGGGKTTFVSLLPHLYDNYDGQIQIDGIDIRDYHLNDLRRQFAIVSQNVTLFNDTIAGNIAYGEQKVDMARLVDAAEAAHVMDFVQLWSSGLDTMVGDDGVLLSGGQRQRVAIARAIYKNAPILILDEATSALDSISERKIQESLELLMHNRTTIIIAHRLTTIEKADKIIVMEKGQIVEVGTHRDLLALNGAYAHLHHIQFKRDDARA